MSSRTKLSSSSNEACQKLLLLDHYPVQTVRINEHPTAFVRYGHGPPLVLLHGYAGALWNWEHQIQSLGEHRTLYIPDLLGHGLSAKPRIAYTPMTYLNWLEGFLNTVGIERADFVGSSMGCGLILGMAITRPERVGRMVLISGFPAQVLNRGGGSHLRRFLLLRMGFLFGLAYQLLGRRAFRKLLRGIVNDPGQITAAVIDRAYRLRKDHGRAWPLWSTLCQLHEWEQQYAPHIGQAGAPTLVLWGQNDGFFPPAVGEELHHSIPGSRFAVIPHAGHLPMWEQPDLVNQLILDFLTS
jgi:pimeloyl-ACP methyl ester carboxylesterase